MARFTLRNYIVLANTVMIAFLLILAGCTDGSGSYTPSQSSSTDLPWRIYVDAATGCQYLYIPLYRRAAMWPRLGSDGKPMCGGVQ
jgi:hypothetical protein